MIDPLHLSPREQVPIVFLGGPKDGLEGKYPWGQCPRELRFQMPRAIDLPIWAAAVLGEHDTAPKPQRTVALYKMQPPVPGTPRVVYRFIGYREE